MNSHLPCDKNIYYIYLDTKIEGAVEQLTRYFRAGIFTRDACISVLCKSYKEIDRLIGKKFRQLNIPHRFIRRHADLDLEGGKTVFYLFNAQSNCRVVAQRDLVHIFVTHGDSHKLASVKPIIRIYDYVISAGQAGIQRYLKTGIFSESDIQSGKIIAMGDTFIGANPFIYSKDAASLVYAPTWEGGVPEENYSSIGAGNAEKMIRFCQQHGIKNIYLQPHPNIGHRDKSYRKALTAMMAACKARGITVRLVASPRGIGNVLDRLRRAAVGPLAVRYALTDISAMETQFIAQGIPCSVFIRDASYQKLPVPRSLAPYYQQVRVADSAPLIRAVTPEIAEAFRPVFCSFSAPDVELLTFSQRVAWLCQYALAHKTAALAVLDDKY